MDGTRFDALTRGLASGRGLSRRGVLRGLAATVFGGAIAAKPAVDAVDAAAAATCYPSGQYCNADSECCQGTCTLGICRCPAGLVNCNGLCRDNCSGCQTGWRLCNGVCRDTRTDQANCGGCGARCAKGSHCEGGKCCRQGEVNCGGLCVPRIQCV